MISKTVIRKGTDNKTCFGLTMFKVRYSCQIQTTFNTPAEAGLS